MRSIFNKLSTDEAGLPDDDEDSSEEEEEKESS